MTTRQSESRPRQLLLALAFCAGIGACAPACAEGIFLCVDANGRRELTDTNKPGCKEINVPGAIAAPARHGNGGGNGAARAAAPSVAPANFPKVDTAQQKARDDSRRDILNEELRAEQRKLAELRKNFNNGVPERQGNERNYAKYQERVGEMRDNINRSEKDIEALQRELNNIK